MLQKKVLLLLVPISLFTATPPAIDSFYELGSLGGLFPSIDLIACAEAFELLKVFFNTKLLSPLPTLNYSAVSATGIIVKTLQSSKQDTLTLYSPLCSAHFTNSLHHPNPLLQKDDSLQISYEEVPSELEEEKYYLITQVTAPEKALKLGIACPYCRTKKSNDLTVHDTTQKNIEERKRVIIECKNALYRSQFKDLIQNQLLSRATTLQEQNEERKEQARIARKQNPIDEPPIECDALLLAEAHEDESLLAKTYHDLRKSASDLFRVSSDLFKTSISGSSESPHSVPKNQDQEDEEWVVVE